MALSIERFDTHNRHGYRVTAPDGRVLADDLVGITTVLGILDKSGGLVPWASRLAADHFKTEIRRIIDQQRPDDLLALLDVDGYQIAEEYRKRAADQGTDVHALCAEIATDRTAINRLPADLPPAQVYMVKAFARWISTAVETVYSTERAVVCVECGYGATMDLEVKLATGEDWIIDLKTSGTLQDSMALQLTAQHHAVSSTKWGVCPGYPSSVPPEATGVKLGVLWLGAPEENGGKKKKREAPKDGCELVELVPDYGALQAALTAYKWRRKKTWRVQ